MKSGRLNRWWVGVAMVLAAVSWPQAGRGDANRLAAARAFRGITLVILARDKETQGELDSAPALNPKLKSELDRLVAQARQMALSQRGRRPEQSDFGRPGTNAFHGRGLF